MVKKFNVSMSDELLDKVDRYSERNFISRSGLLSLAVSQYLKQDDIMNLMLNLNAAVQKIARTGSVDDSVQKDLEDFRIMMNLLLSNK